MRVLVACEFSGTVRDAFAKRGHAAWSCDLLPSESSSTYQHFQGDIKQFIKNMCADYFDLIIAHPPCTHLAVSGARWFKDKVQEQKEAIEFVEWLWDLDCPRIAIENPVGVLPKRSKLGKSSQIIQPWQFGHGETKATCLWLKNLPKLIPTNIVEGREGKVWKMAPGPDRAKNRSRTYQGIANAMAEQWGNLEINTQVENL